MRKLILGLGLLTSTAAIAEYPAVLDPVVNATPPGAKVSAGYFALTNNSDETLTITDAFSPDIPLVEIHLSSIKDDVAKMEKQDSVTVEVGETLRFEQGGLHIMLMGLEKPLVENTSIDLVLTTSAGDMLIEMPVKKLGSGHSPEKAMLHDHMKDEAKSADNMSADKKEHGSMHHGSSDEAASKHDSMSAEK